MTPLTYALALLAVVGLAGTARLAQEHHVFRAAQIAIAAVVSWTRHRYRRRFHGLGTRVLGRDTPRTTPIRHTRKAAA